MLIAFEIHHKLKLNLEIFQSLLFNIAKLQEFQELVLGKNEGKQQGLVFWLISKVMMPSWTKIEGSLPEMTSGNVVAFCGKKCGNVSAN